MSADLRKLIAVASIQRTLRSAGYDVLVDGIVGSETEAAYYKYQRESAFRGNGTLSLSVMIQDRTRLAESFYRGEGVVRAAEKHLGQQEKKGNSGFLDARFESLMRGVGWFRGAAWCDFFAELVWSEVYHDNPALWLELRACFTGSTIRSFRNFQEMGVMPVVQQPARGALVYWRHGVMTGHVGIVTEVKADSYIHISGNTTSLGGREGYIVAKKEQKLVSDKRRLGFVLPLV